jgi:hypothetical protein
MPTGAVRIALVAGEDPEEIELALRTTRQRLCDLAIELEALQIAAHLSAPYALRVRRQG